MADLARARDKWRKRADDIPLFIANFLRSKEEYHVEEEFEGELMSVEAIVADGNFQVVGLTSRSFFSRNPVVETGACFPYPHPLSSEIFQFVERAHQILGLTEGATHTELIVNPEGEMEIIDLNPRFIGADHLPAINLAYGMKIEEALLDWALGKRFTLQFSHTHYSCLQYILPPHDLRFESIEFPQADDIKFHTSLVERGAWVTSNDRETDFLGCYITLGSSFSAAVKRSRELRSCVTINGGLLGAY
jgi:biotin carboxylase